MKFFPNMLASAMVSVTLSLCAAVEPAHGQSSTLPDWQTAAGGKMSFTDPDGRDPRRRRRSEPSRIQPIRTSRPRPRAVRDFNS